MSVNVLYEPRFGDLAPTVEPLAAWAGRRSNAPPQQASPEPVGTPGWMDRLNWALGSSFVTCCLALSWVEYRPATDGIDVSLVFDPDLLPEHLVLSSGDGGGSAQGLQRPARGATYVFDQACGSYSLLETIHFVGAFFISPLARDAVFRVIEVMPVTDWSRRHGDFGDWLIELTGPSRRHTSSMNCRLTTHWGWRRDSSPSHHQPPRSAKPRRVWHLQAPPGDRFVPGAGQAQSGTAIAPGGWQGCIPNASVW